MRSLLLTAALFVALPVGAVNIEYVAVRDSNNAADTATNCVNAAPDCGSVDHVYYISKYEVTNSQYAEFLNAVAAADPNGLYNTDMNNDVSTSTGNGGITRAGSEGSYSYTVKSGRENNSVVFVSFYDALRFANWLHNGQPTDTQNAGTTEDGAYTITPAGILANSITRNTGAITFLPNENEWYKAAYYDAGSATYFEFPTGTNTVPLSTAPPGDANSANYNDPTTGFALTGSTSFVAGFDYLTDVGAYASSLSPAGTLDQGGNASEWVENILSINRVRRGGDWHNGFLNLSASDPNIGQPAVENPATGFRVATLVPEPAQVLLVLTGGLVLAAARRRRA
jgi:formylglycine-generating enzyme required for sulfatase activity